MKRKDDDDRSSAPTTNEGLLTLTKDGLCTGPSMKFFTVALVLSRAAAFAPPSNVERCYAASRLSSTENGDNAVAVVDRTETESVEDSLAVPLTYNEMVSQVADTMALASEKGYKRQLVRILLPRDASSGKLGEMYEPQAETSTRAKAQEMKLIPTDESWQGGIMQLLRACTPTMTDVMTELCPTYKTTGVPPSILEDRKIDESGVDGVSLLYTSTGSSANTKESSGGGGFFGGFLGDFTPPTLSDDDVCVFVQPTQEIIESVSSISSASNDALIALVNPQWRNVDDALDSASSQDNIFGAFASFCKSLRFCVPFWSLARCSNSSCALTRKSKLFSGRQGKRASTVGRAGLHSNVHPRGLRL